jgi:hypothetical protein
MNFRTRLRDKFRRIGGWPLFSPHAVETLEPSAKNTKVLLGRGLAHLNSQLPDDATIPEMEFQVFSQFGDDGIIQFLISHLPISHRTFVEFGVEDYREANTRFLLVNNRWKGLVLDGDPANIRHIKEEKLYLYHDLDAKQAFITRENINQLITSSGFSGEIGILSVDLDGVDYWVWEAIDSVQPVIVIAEYNSCFGAEHCVTVPYRPDFQWNRQGNEVYRWGASLGALNALAEKKGYDLFGCNSAGNNSYFIRKDCRGNLPKADVKTAFVDAQFALARNENGDAVRGTKAMPYLRGARLHDVVTGKEIAFDEKPS